MPSSVCRALAAAALFASSGAASAGDRARSSAMPFSDCLALMQEIAAELGPEAMTVGRTRDVHAARIRAADGEVILGCSRTDQTVNLVQATRDRQATLGSPPRP